MKSRFVKISLLSALLLGAIVSFTGCSEETPDENRAISFDGVDDYIDLGDVYDDLALPVTVSAWVWIDPTATGSQPIFDTQDGTPVYNGVLFTTSDVTHVGIQYGDGQGENNVAYRRAKSGTISPAAGGWVCLAGVMRSATDMSVYVNGVEITGSYSGTSNLPMNSNAPDDVAKIGTYHQNGLSYMFKGKIDDLKIWDRALSQQEIMDAAYGKQDRNDAGLIGYWNFDEADGSNIIDKSSNHFDGVLKGNAQRVISDAPVESAQ